jgi:hypothetical protein
MSCRARAIGREAHGSKKEKDIQSTRTRGFDGFDHVHAINNLHSRYVIRLFCNAQTHNTCPKTTCLPSSQAVGTVVMKNWLPLVFGPALAMDSMPAACTSSRFKRRRATRAAHRVLQLEVFIREFLAVYALAAGAVEAREITTLNHEALDHTMEDAAAVTAQVLLNVSRKRC